MDGASAGPRGLRQIARHMGCQGSAAAAASTESATVEATVGAALRTRLGSYAESGQAEGKSIGSGIAAFQGGRSSRYGLSTRYNTPLPETNSFGVPSVIPGLGILPRKVRTTAEAAERVRSDGAVILTGEPKFIVPFIVVDYPLMASLCAKETVAYMRTKYKAAYAAYESNVPALFIPGIW